MAGSNPTAAAAGSDWYQSSSSSAQDPFSDARAALNNMLKLSRELIDPRDVVDSPSAPATRDPLLVLLPLLIILSSLLFCLLLFLIFAVFIRRRQRILLRDSDGPVDMSREELIDGEGGFEGVEGRWLESVDEETRRAYRRAKDYQTQYPPNSLPTDITLSQFLSIQEKGVSAWSFEPDYESNAFMLVHARTELTFLPDPSSSTCVQSNLPLPKLNEVYYWEVKLFDLPETTSVAIGLSTKPYPAFRLPGFSRFSVAYHSNGEKSHNYPFTAQSYGAPLKEGDVLGVGYRPRTGTVFYTRNGRKMDDAFIGLTRWNLFPTVGADGPCSLHVNLGQSGFVFIEANVKKWGLAPSIGTLAPPPAYGSERGSILLEAGGGVRPVDATPSPPAQSIYGTPPSSSRRHRTRRPKPPSSLPPHSSPLRHDAAGPQTPRSPPPPITPITEEGASEGAGTSSGRYISPTDAPFHTPAPPTNLPPSPPAGDVSSGSEQTSAATSRSPSRSPVPVIREQLSAGGHSRNNSAAAMAVRLLPPPESPLNPEPPSPNNQTDIHLRAMTPAASQPGASGATSPQDVPIDNSRAPPQYSPIDAYVYENVHLDIPTDFIAAVLEGGSIPASAIGTGQSARSERHRSRREQRR